MRTAVVIVAAHNTAHYIQEAIDSIRRSATRVGPGWQVDIRVGVDGCDATACALDAIGESYWWSPTNVGCFRLRNSLIALGAADVYLPFDSDDVMLPQYLPVLLEVLPKAGVAGVARFEVGPRLEQSVPPTVKRYAEVGGGNGAFSRAAWDQLGSYWTAHRGGMDLELMDRARKAGIPWAAVHTPLFLRRRNPTSLTQGPFTRRGTPMRTAALDAIATRAQDATCIHEPLATTPLSWCPRHPVARAKREGPAPTWALHAAPVPMTRLAVLLTAYQASAWVLDAVQSIQASASALPAGVTVDLRIGVDACDTTARVLAAAGVGYYRPAENVGTYVLRNSLALVAPADAYVMFDADDLMRLPFLPTVARALETSAYVGPGRVDSDMRGGPRHVKPYAHGVCAVRHDLWTALGGYHAERYAADQDLCLRATDCAGVWIPRDVAETPLYVRRRHPDSLSQHPDTNGGARVRRHAQQRMAHRRLRGGGWCAAMPSTPLTYVVPSMVEE